VELSLVAVQAAGAREMAKVKAASQNLTKSDIGMDVDKNSI